MNSLGIFYDVNLKKSNDLMDVFEQALSKTNNLMETMDNFNSYKVLNKNSITIIKCLINFFIYINL